MDNQAENRITKASKAWLSMYALAREYYAAHGNLDVPSNYVTPEGAHLGAWLNRMRRVREGKQRGTLTQTQIEALDAVGMSWNDRSEERWNRNYAALCAYYERFGDLDVPLDYVTPDGIRLGNFVKNLRFHRDTKYRRCLTPSRVIALTEMGMIWDMVEYRWREGYRCAEAYYREHGNLAVPQRTVSTDGFKLGVWLTYQRRKRERGELSESREKQLDAIGMQW